MIFIMSIRITLSTVIELEKRFFPNFKEWLIRYDHTGTSYWILGSSAFVEPLISNKISEKNKVDCTCTCTQRVKCQPTNQSNGTDIKECTAPHAPVTLNFGITSWRGTRIGLRLSQLQQAWLIAQVMTLKVLPQTPPPFILPGRAW